MDFANMLESEKKESNRSRDNKIIPNYYQEMHESVFKSDEHAKAPIFSKLKFYVEIFNRRQDESRILDTLIEMNSGTVYFKKMKILDYKTIL
jgi:hypothetical protein